MRLVLVLIAAFAGCWLPAAQPAHADDVVATDRVETNVVVRRRPSTSSAAIGALRPGERLLLLGDVPRWYRVQLPDGRVGYVSKNWTEVEPTPAHGVAAQYVVHAVDVGTGLAIFIEGPDFTLVYDGGSNDDLARGANNRFLAYLRHARPDLQRIDHVVLSHPHRDHVELLPDLFEQYQVRNVWDSGRVHPICGYRAFLDRVDREPGAVYHNALVDNGPHRPEFDAATCYGANLPPVTLTLDAGEQIRTGVPIALGTDAQMTFLYADGAHHASPNENSLVMRIDLGQVRILFMGDAEAGGRRDPSEAPLPGSIEAELLDCCEADLRADILVVGHHGSMTSSRNAFVDAVGAETFIISSGPTRYGSVTLPDAVVVATLDADGTVWRTDLDDAACASDTDKIGADADGEVGGCDNIRIAIDGAGVFEARYERVAD